MKHLVWFGPVSTAHVRASVPEGYQLHVVNCVGDVAPDRNGDGEPDFARCLDVAARWRDEDGRRLPALRRKLGLAPDERPFFAAFSAGGQCVRRLLLDPRDRAELAGVYLADATYAGWARPGVVLVDELQEALVDFAVECAADGRPFVATASPHAPGGGGPSAAVVLDALRARLVERGLTFGDESSGRWDALASSEAVWRCGPPPGRRRGSVFLASYSAAVAHASHATELAAIILPVAEGWCS